MLGAILKKTMKYFYWIILILAFCGCNIPQENESKCYPKDTLISDMTGKPKDSLTYYFPRKVFKDSSFISTNIDTFKLDWYSVNLSCFKAPILYNFYLNRDIFRFLWLRSFHDNVIITLERTKDKVILTTIRLIYF